MTLQEFTRDVAPLIGLGLGSLGLGSLALLWVQIRQTAKWNKLQGQAAFLNRPGEQIEEAAQQQLLPMGIDLRNFTRAVSAQEAASILANQDAYYRVKTYMNLYEDLAAGVRIGFIDDDFAYALESARLINVWKQFAEFVDLLRAEAGDDEVYIELENVAARWDKRMIKEADRREKELQAGRARMGIARPKG